MGIFILQFALSLILNQKFGKNVATLLEVIDLLLGKSSLLQQPSESSLLLLGVVGVASQLGQGPEVIVDRLVLQVLARLLDLFGRGFDILETARGHIFGKEGVNNIDRSGLGVQSSAYKSMSAGFRIDEIDQSFFASSTTVGLRLCRSLGEEFDSRVAGDSLSLGSSLRSLGFCVNFRNEDIGFRSEVSGEFLPGRGERFAVWVQLD